MLTEKEIQQAAIEMMPKVLEQNNYDYSKMDAFENAMFLLAFEAGYKLALEQMKQKPLEYFVLESEDGAISDHRTMEQAEQALLAHQKQTPRKYYWIETKTMF